MAQTNKMPANTSRDAPKFDPDRPGELIRFFKLVEDLFKQCSVTDVAEQKDYAGRYTDSQTEREWQAMDSFDNGTWEKFKAEVIASYPEAKSLTNGSLKALRDICKTHSRLSIKDNSELKSLKRKFNAESKKLLTPPSIISNRELVDMFLACLEERFRSEVYTRLSATTATKQATPNFRAEDPYELKEVMEAAELLVEGPSGVLASDSSVGSAIQITSKKDTTEIKAEVEEIKQVVAGLQDRVAVTQKNMTEGFGDLKQIIQQNNLLFQNAMQQNAIYAQKAPMPPPMNYGAPTYSRPSYPPRDPKDDRCFYCHERNHVMEACPERNRHLEEKKTVLHDGKIRMFDGSWIPGGPKESPIMDRVEAVWNKKHNTSAATAQLYLGPEDEDDHGIYMLPSRDQNVFSSYSNAVYDNRDDIIDRLRRQVDQLQLGSRRQEPSRNHDSYHDGYSSNGHHGPRFQDRRDHSSDRSKQDEELRHLASLIGKLASKDQFAATRSGQQTARDDDEEDFQEVRGRRM